MTDCSCVAFFVFGKEKDAADEMFVGDYACVRAHVKSMKHIDFVSVHVSVDQIWNISSAPTKFNRLEVCGEIRKFERLNSNSAKVILATFTDGYYNTVSVYIPNTINFNIAPKERLHFIEHVESIPNDSTTYFDGYYQTFTAEYQIENKKKEKTA